MIQTASSDLPDNKLRDVIHSVAERVSPTEEERAALNDVAAEIEADIKAAIEEESAPADTSVERAGSTARGTFLTGDSDIDLFVEFPPTISRERLETLGLKVGKAVLPNPTVDYAEHPYVKGEYDGFDVDIVPCFGVDDAAELKSSVDRTPFHTRYLREQLTDELRADVRVAKAFLKANGLYGANAKVNGFSGYLTELLVLKYNGFEPFVKAAAGWDETVSIDVEGHYPPGRVPDEYLYVVDPVDPDRNVAAAVFPQKKAELIHASRELLENPSVDQFEDDTPDPLSPSTVESEFNLRGTHPVGVAIGTPPGLTDEERIQQARRSLGGIRRGLEELGFDVLRDTVFTSTTDKDDKVTVALLFELDREALPAVERHTGPPVTRRNGAESFANIYGDDILGELRIENDHYVAEVERDITTATEFLMSSESFDVAHGDVFRDKFGQNEFWLLNGSDDISSLAKDDDFAHELADFFEPNL